MEPKAKDFWNKNYKEDKDYHEISAALIDKIIHASNQGKSLLDLGSGTGDLLRKFENLGFETVGLELSDEAIKIAKERGTKADLVLQNLETLNDYKLDKKFDIITVKLVFAFIKNKEVFLDWVKNHLSNDGVLILITPIKSKDKPWARPGIEIEESELELVLRNHFNQVELLDEEKSELGFSNTYACKA